MSPDAGASMDAEHAANGMRVHALLSRLAEYGYAGSAAVGGQDGLWFAAAYGLRDRERGLPFEVTTAVDIGSLTKVFTATLIMRLAEEHLLDVNARITRYLPDVPPDKAGITVHHLLTHTSGLLRSAVALGIDEHTERDAFVAAVLESDLLYSPGDRFEYSDTGYDLLAALAEIVTGQPYDEALTVRVLRPAGLHHTRYIGSSDASPGTVSDSYSAPLGSPWLDDREGPSVVSWYNRGSGGLVSTTRDLQALARALDSGRLLRPATVARMRLPSSTVSADVGYGYGWFVKDDGDGRVVFHGGDIAGYKAHLEIDLESGRIVSVLDNVLGWERVTDRYVVDAWDGAGPGLPPRVHPSPGSAHALAGTYRTDDGGVLVLWDESGLLGAEGRGQAVVDLLFGITDRRLWDRTAAAESVMTAVAAGDAAYLSSTMRDRDRITGMPQRLLRIWTQLAAGRGPARETHVTGSYPAQDGTMISFVTVRRDAGADPLRLIWRGDRLVSVGGGEGLRVPTAALTSVDSLTAARFEPSTGMTTLIRLTGAGTLTLSVGDRSVLARRDAATPISPPAPSLARAVTPVFLREGPQAGLEAIRRLQEDRPDAFHVSERALNQLGYRLLHARGYRSAIAVFRLNVEEHPASWNAHDSLGEAYLAAGEIAAARQSYAESLRLNPENETARRVLAETEGRR
jgi:CubicO group peptidase (beta-lactamase class C family)